jgi:hypothetical protein
MFDRSDVSCMSGAGACWNECSRRCPFGALVRADDMRPAAMGDSASTGFGDLGDDGRPGREGSQSSAGRNLIDRVSESALTDLRDDSGPECCLELRPGPTPQMAMGSGGSQLDVPIWHIKLALEAAARLRLLMRPTTRTRRPSRAGSWRQARIPWVRQHAEGFGVLSDGNALVTPQAPVPRSAPAPPAPRR